MDELCKGCRRETHPAYLDRYNGYCLDCSNQGVPERDEEIEKLKNRLRLNPYVCDVCFTSSFEPCEESEKDAVKDPGAEGWMSCAYCKMHDALLLQERDHAESVESLYQDVLDAEQSEAQIMQLYERLSQSRGRLVCAVRGLSERLDRAISERDGCAEFIEKELGVPYSL